MQTKKWLQSAINPSHKGRCKNLGDKDCPKGSPQYNLAITLKKNHGFHNKNKK